MQNMDMEVPCQLLRNFEVPSHHPKHIVIHTYNIYIYTNSIYIYIYHCIIIILLYICTSNQPFFVCSVARDFRPYRHDQFFCYLHLMSANVFELLNSRIFKVIQLISLLSKAFRCV